MRDVSAKSKTLRTATARAVLRVNPLTIDLIRQDRIPKGNPLEVAKVAAIQAAKNTSQLIPYCHPIPVDFVGVEFEIVEREIEVTVTVKAVYKTGVEMEALSAASVAALTLYDMMKMLDADMEIVGVKLLRKKGGKSDFAEPSAGPLRAAVLVTSDSVSAGEKEDRSGKIIAERLTSEGFEVVDYRVVPDDSEGIRSDLLRYADEMQVDLVITTGGTGLGPRDNTPEAAKEIIERQAPGMAEAMRTYGLERTPYAMLSRGVAGVRGNTLIVNLPGSSRGAAESLDALFPALFHGFKMLAGGGHPAHGRDKQKAGS